MTSAAQNNTFDVAVVGLGPVGSLGAILFAEAGLRVVALENQTDVWALPRAVNLDGEIIRALQPAGLAKPVQQLMQPLREGGQIYYGPSRGLLCQTFARHRYAACQPSPVERLAFQAEE